MAGHVVVLAPHPDDEVLGVGGTLARAAADGWRTTVVVVTKGRPPLFDERLIDRGRAEARDAHAILGVTEAYYLDLPAAELDTVPHHAVNAAIARILTDTRPDVLFVPFLGDIHSDHQHVFWSALVSARPSSAAMPAEIHAYETLSETNWNAPYLTPTFHPNMFVDIGEYLETKVRAMEAYESQVRPAPDERSIATLRALATLRGSTVGLAAAEAFVTVRRIW